MNTFQTREEVHQYDPYSQNIMFKKNNTLEKKGQNTFVTLKKSKTIRHNTILGFEYDHDITTDKDYYQRIFDFNCYNPNSHDSTKIAAMNRKVVSAPNKENHSPSGSLEGTDLAPNGNSTITSSLSVQELEATLGKYACKKLGKKAKNPNGFVQEEFYLIKMKWLVKMAKIQHQTHKYNLNNFRLTIEKIIQEASPAFEVQIFQNQKKIAKRLQKLSNFLAKLEPQKAILLSYKLFKIYLKQVDIYNPQTQIEIANKFYNVFLPYIKLMEIKQAHPKEKIQKKRTNLITYKKIKKFSQKPYIVDILSKYHDPKKTPEYAENFRLFLREKVSLEKALRELAIQGREVILEKPPVYVEGQVLEDPHVPEIIKSLDSLDHAHVSQRSGHCESSFEDAQSIDLSEKRSIMGSPGLQNYVFMKKATLMSRTNIDAQNPDQILNTSEDSSGENQFEEGGTEQELMDDPELYERKESSKGSGENKEGNNPNELDLDIDNEAVLGKLRLEGTYSTPSGMLVLSPTKCMRYRSIPGPLDRDLAICTKADPLRVSERVEFVRVNSYDNIPQPEERQRQMEEELGSPSKLKKDELAPLRVSQRNSTRKSISSISKTKKEIAFQKVLSLAYDQISKWEKVIQNPTVVIEKIKPENSPVLLLRAWAVIEGFTVPEIFEQIYNTDKRVKWDTVTAGISTVEKIDDTSDIIHFIIKTPFGITERDFLQRRDFIFDYPEKGTITMSFQSCVHPAKPPTKNRIRGETHIAGYIIKPSATKPNCTDLCVLTQCDIKGKVPKAIVNMCASRAPADWIAKLKKACERSRLGHH